MKRIFAFTIAEVMISLTIIGIISAVILPAAMHSKPDDNVMKFKKAHNTLFQVVSKLISSDKYYYHGDLGLRPSDNPDKEYEYVKGSYFCKSFADAVSVKNIACNREAAGGNVDGFYFSCNLSFDGAGNPATCSKVDIETELDNLCDDVQTSMSANENIGVITTDDTVFYEPTLKNHFGCLIGDTGDDDTAEICEYKDDNWGDRYNTERLYNNEEIDIVQHEDGTFAPRAYKVFCLDVDGVKNGEAPFGYGIRVDGKILVGARAKEWLKKDIQGEE